MKWGHSLFASKWGQASLISLDDLQGEWRAPPKFNSLYIGLERYADSAHDQNLWIDDVALSKARVGCPGKQKRAKP